MAIGKLGIIEAMDMIREEKAVLVDVLVPEHFERRHIPGAVNACVYEVGFLALMQKIIPDKNAAVLLYGAGPGSLDCLAAAEKLERVGYAHVYYFPGGLEEWREEGYPLEGSAVRAVDPPHPELVLEQRVYPLAAQASVIRWTGRSANGSHYGLLPVSAGEFDARSMTGEFKLDMLGLKNLDLEGDELHPVLEEHLHSDDFFFTSLFPDAVFRITGMQAIPDAPATLPNYRVMGDLTMCGASREVFFAAQLRNATEGVSLQGNLDLDRTEWGIIYGSSRFFQHLGYHVVFDLISVDFRVLLV